MVVRVEVSGAMKGVFARKCESRWYCRGMRERPVCHMMTVQLAMSVSMIRGVLGFSVEMWME
jgi:hypothetical protein